MKTAVRYCLVCEEKIRRGRCRCDSGGVSVHHEPLNFQRGRIVRSALAIVALAGLGWLLSRIF